ncbi:hypothetical protein [Desulfurispora thermophila]|uniref:hypothetical protein n=1 Tax=Desulfurispora thermophila TaxID=265470 RepID=UPI00037308E3|nr:hypothetical protein [Desulfurispora thermophila]
MQLACNAKQSLVKTGQKDSVSLLFARLGLLQRNCFIILLLLQYRAYNQPVRSGLCTKPSAQLMCSSFMKMRGRLVGQGCRPAW